MRGFCLFLFSLILVGCGSAPLVIDKSAPAIEANYPTAEFRACGKLWHGMGACRLKSGQLLSDLKLSVQGYHQGTIRVYASGAECGFDESVSYGSHALVEFSIPGTIASNCTLGILVSPQYPHPQDQAVVVRSMLGFLRVRVTEHDWRFHALEFPEHEALRVPLDVAGFNGQKVRVNVEGCGQSLEYETLVPPAPRDGGGLAFELPGIPTQNCFLEVAMSVDSNHSRFFTYGVSAYAKGFVPLAIPHVSDQEVYADEAVSWIGVQYPGSEEQSWSSGSYALFKRLPSAYLLRVLTTAGRSTVLLREGELWTPIR